MADIRTVKEQHERGLMGLDGVVLVGITRLDSGEEAIKVGLDGEHFPDIPASLDGYPVVQEVVGQPEFWSASGTGRDETPGTLNTSRYRPIPNGASACHVNCSACTAAFHLIGDDGTEYLASNNHCFARFNGDVKNDGVIQPSDWDGGSPNDVVARMDDYVPIEDGATVDMAWARVLDEDSGGNPVSVESELFGVGPIEGDVYDPQPGDVLTKSGRTTGVTSGEVLDTDVTIDVRFLDGSLVTFHDQLSTNIRSLAGDSGSPAVYEDESGRNRPAAVIFAGSENHTFMNKASNWVAESGLSIKAANMADPEKMSVQGCTTDSTGVGGEDATLSVDVRNDNNLAVAYGLDVFIGGVRAAELDRTLPANSDHTVSTTVTVPRTLGTHDITYEFAYVEDA